MALQSYEVKTKLKITRQEGDTGSIVFICPAEISMTSREAQFTVRDVFDDLVFEKSSLNSGDEITIAGQTITVNLNGEETKEFSGTHYWDLQVTDDDEITTIAKGTFVIAKEYTK